MIEAWHNVAVPEIVIFFGLTATSRPVQTHQAKSDLAPSETTRMPNAQSASIARRKLIVRRSGNREIRHDDVHRSRSIDRSLNNGAGLI